MKPVPVRRAVLGLGCALSLLAGVCAEEKGAPSAAATTHEQIAAYTVKGAGGKITLQTLCVNAKGDIVALVALPRNYGAPQKGASSEVHVLAPDGKERTTWSVDFHANSVNVGPDGTVYVAGDGKVARFGADGTPRGKLELPHIARLLADKESLTKQAEEQLKSQKENFGRMVKSYEDMKKKLQEKKAEERTKLEQRQLDQYDEIIRSLAQSKKYYDEMTVESIIEQLTSRLRVINAIAASDKDVFIVCGESKGYGFAVWRMDLDLGNPKQVLSNVVGCCGQMDVQCCGNDILVAENTRHRYARYTRDGKEVGAWGKRGGETEPACFGGCCNPMNVRCCATGDVFTAESEGIVKRFSAKGDYLGIVGISKLTGGCKNTAVATSPDGERVYLCDQPGSRVIVMAPRTAKKSD